MSIMNKEIKKSKVVIENITNTKLGRTKVVDECYFSVYYKDLKFGVHAYLLDKDEHDTYSIRVYDNSQEKYRYAKEDINQIAHAYMDSMGGSSCDENLTIYPLNRSVGSNHLLEVEERILETLFGNHTKNIKGIIKPF